MNYKLPRPTLYPLIPSWSAEAARIRKQFAFLSEADPQVVASVRKAAVSRLEREAPWRLANIRRRLTVAYWAQSLPAGYLVTQGLVRMPLAKRHGTVKPAWLGGRP